MSGIVYAGDLSADLGMGRNCPPKFWRWCKKNGLRSIDGKPMAFERDDVQDALARSKGGR